MSITPTVGRVVLYNPHDTDREGIRHAAIITYVHNDNLVNIAVFDFNGVPYNRQSVTLIQNPKETTKFGDCEWMAYQHGQAQKTETVTDELIQRIEYLEEYVNALIDPVARPDTAKVTGATDFDEEEPNAHNVSEDATETTAEQDIKQGMASGIQTGGDPTIIDDDNVPAVAADGTDESTDATSSTDDGASAEATEEGKVDEDVTESAALMGLKAHASEVAIVGARFIDIGGYVIEEGTDGCVLVEAVFADDVEYTVTFDEWNTIDHGELKLEETAAS